MLMLCPICAGEFMPRWALCPSCGCDLVPSTIDKKAAREVAARGSAIEFVELCRPRGYPVAMLVIQMLEQNGVAAIIQGGYSLSMMPQLAFGGEMRVLVDKQQIEYARELYRAYFESNEEADYTSEDL
jgi:hypothetical protein